MPTVGLSMIVKNGGESLRHCLSSVRATVDQIVIADTGSTDDTQTIAREFGALVVEVPWKNHYAEARNESLRHLVTDWVLVLDADEELAAEAAAEIPKLLTCGPMTGGFRLRQRTYFKERFRNLQGSLSREFPGQPERAAACGAKSYLDNPLCRLFRRRPEFYFKGRIHEIVEHQILASGASLVDTPLVLHHFGELAESEQHLEKQVRYRDLLQQALEEDPKDANLWIQLAINARVYFQQNDEALRAYRRAIELNHASADAWIGVAQILLETGEPRKAMEAAGHLSDRGGEGILKRELAGDALHDLGRLKEARTMYASAWKMAGLDRDYRATGRDGRIESKLGYTEVRLGMHRAGLGKMRRAIRAWPSVLDHHDRLVKALVWLKLNEEAADAAEGILKYFVSERIFSRAIVLNLRVNRRDHAERLWETGVRLLPESSLLRGMRDFFQQAPSSNE